MANKKRRQQAAALARIYARIPEIDCKGLCHDSCGPIGMSFAEARGIEDHTGLALPGFDEARGCCPFLNEENRCGVYEYRPLICRLYGVVPGLSCAHGCIPDRQLTDIEAAALLSEAAEIAGAAPVTLYPRGWERHLARKRAAEAFVDAFALVVERVECER